MPQAILDYVRLQDLELWSYASAEAQVAAIADDIAYDAHDIDDGLRAGPVQRSTISRTCRSSRDILREIRQASRRSSRARRA